MPPPTITTRACAVTLAVMGRLSRLGGRAPGGEEEALGAHDRPPARVHTGDQEVDAPAVGAAPGLPHLDHLGARRDHLPRAPRLVPAPLPQPGRGEPPPPPPGPPRTPPPPRAPVWPSGARGAGGGGAPPSRPSGRPRTCGCSGGW